MKSIFINSKLFFTFIILILPIVNVYQSPIPAITMGDVLLFISMLLLAITYSKNNNRKIKIFVPLIFYVIFILLQFFAFSILKGDNFYFYNSFLQTFHYIFYLFFGIFYLKSNFLNKKGFRIFKFIGLFSTIFLIIQEIFLRLFNFYIPGNLPFLKLTNESLDEFNKNASSVTEFLIRPRSIFPEPAHYAQYILVILSIILGKKNSNKNDYLLASFFTLGILISRSSTGMFLMIMIWLFHFLIKLSNKKIKFKFNSIFNIIFLIPILILMIVNSSFFNDFINRFVSNDGLGQSAVSRFEAYNQIFNNLKFTNTLTVIFGNGMLDNIYNNIYLPGFARLFTYFGLIGIVIIFFIYSYLLKNVKKEKFFLVILMILINLGGDSIFGPSMLIFLPFILTSFKKNKEDELIVD